ncbi:GCN5-related N-acetyltransferase [Rhodospirillum rubrum ATCC 11170]|uniref:GCN5-related N-acetyltransferase n=1 Tax=Rhodospirillum rubrum (strain ATCC 11170 / ATH 1.1.1 / DSM 467 / LMG 4362 / NCIMB 8255 / S1) TaxID=269796 RepID=Q2RWY9_RHORT|nr:GNAT family protein [Rhodospirillum rubrum]ABC21356.1 GCN5-related N-acetyltransferase [Rhodospirillum rubrum ATCC 11170]MBK5952942.1 N-acetyltransferase [Rhodospirillum rubrum]HAP99890.1 N-acetyltransferase [Rhodospirillum rubrum]HCF16535.1 N-acetyltransferase [Rhodospirillum rubrum]
MTMTPAAVPEFSPPEFAPIEWPLTGRPGRATDLPFILRQEARPDYAPFILPWPRERHGHAMTESDHQYILFQDSGARPVGFVILAGLTNPHHAVELVRMIAVRPGLGIGKAMMEAVIDHAFSGLGANRLWLDVFSDNTRARQVYADMGFVHEGDLREGVLGANGYRTLAIMSILAREYRSRAASRPAEPPHAPPAPASPRGVPGATSAG